MVRLPSGARWGAVVVLMVAGAFATRVAGEEARRPIPTASEQEEALATIRPIFQKDFAAAKTAAQQLAIAQKIVEVARSSGDDNVERYALYRVARDIYAKSNELAPLLELAREVEEQFAADGGRFRVDGLAGLIRGATLPSKKAQLAIQFESVVEQAVAAEKFPVARESLNHALNLARASNDKDLPRRLAEREQILDKQQELYTLAAAAIDKADPSDHAGLLAVGKYLAFIKRDFPRGLALLATASDAALAAQAKADAANPAEPTQLAAVADGWWQLADKFPELAPGMKARAVELYRTALPGLTGLLRTKVQQRVAAAGDAVPERKASWLVVFRSANPDRWNTDYKGDEGMAKALRDLPQFKYLKMSQPGKVPAAAVIIPLTPERLTRRSIHGDVGWEGTKENHNGGTHLGIFHDKIASDRPGQASIAHKNPPLDYSGWGFGHLHSGREQIWCWEGKLLPADTVFEISLSAGPLSKQEEKLLLK